VPTSEDTNANDGINPLREVARFRGTQAASLVRHAVVATALFVSKAASTEGLLLHADGCFGVAVKADFAVIAVGK